MTQFNLILHTVWSKSLRPLRGGSGLKIFLNQQAHNSMHMCHRGSLKITLVVAVAFYIFSFILTI